MFHQDFQTPRCGLKNESQPSLTDFEVFSIPDKTLFPVFDQTDLNDQDLNDTEKTNK